MTTTLSVGWFVTYAARSSVLPKPFIQTVSASDILAQVSRAEAFVAIVPIYVRNGAAHGSGNRQYSEKTFQDQRLVFYFCIHLTSPCRCLGHPGREWLVRFDLHQATMLAKSLQRGRGRLRG